MKLRDIFDRAAAIKFIESHLGGEKPEKGASSRIAGSELELRPVEEGDVEMMVIGDTPYGIPEGYLSDLLYPPKAPE